MYGLDIERMGELYSVRHAAALVAMLPASSRTAARMALEDARRAEERRRDVDPAELARALGIPEERL
ncbi:MAG: hypothetical protein Q4B30_06270 [Coriobacteriaceae bacterium]|nr:hypothetical protein [Coriobacteriaceae bacterium]